MWAQGKLREEMQLLQGWPTLHPHVLYAQTCTNACPIGDSENDSVHLEYEYVTHSSGISILHLPVGPRRSQFPYSQTLYIHGS